MQLSTLVIGTDTGVFDTLINSFRSLPSLQTLRLRLSSNKPPPANCPTLSSSDIPRLRHISISLVKGPWVSFYWLLNIFTKRDALVGVEQFGFYGSGERIQPTDLLHVIHALRNSTFMGFWQFDFDKSHISADLGINLPVHTPNLLHLEIPFSAVIPFIDAPILRSLYITPSVKTPLNIPDYFGRGVTTLRITAEAFNSLMIPQANHWDSLEEVIWTSDEPSIGLKTTTFRSIRYVHFIESSSNKATYNPINCLNSFLLALLRHPDACPHLRTIKSVTYPAWALLAQVLLQRNRNSDLVQLEEIWLPGLPIPPLLSFVVRLLNGSSNEVIPMEIDHIIMRRYQHALL
jgi:hypothetical protein